MDHPLGHLRYVSIKEDEGAPFTDNREVSLNGGWWRDDKGNWLEYRSKEAFLIEIPVVVLLPWEKYETLKVAFEAAPEEVVLCSDIHPYDIQSDITGAVDENTLELLRQTLRQIKADFSPQFINVVQFAEMCEN